MDIAVRCGFCGAGNLSSSFSCSECFMPLIDEPATAEGANTADGAAAPAQEAPASLAPPPPPAREKVLGPYTGPARPKTAAPEVVEEEDQGPEPSPSPLPGYRIGGNVIAGRDEAEAMAPLTVPRDPNRVVWRWHHVVALGLLVWGMPFAVDWWLGIDRSLASLLNRALAVQIVGYLVGALAVAALVWTRRSGDWSTLGLGNDARQGRIDVVRGVGFGLAMFLGYLPVGLFTNGRTSLDPMVALLLGNANGIGLVLTCAIVVVGAPVVEEIFFRGLLYEKLARRFTELAIIVTSVLFMLIHRALILQILVLGLVFAIKRSKGESVWFTIGAHSAWNASVIVVGIVMLTGSAVQFTSPSGSYELSYGRDWEREEAMEMSVLTGHIDLALAAANGSIIGVIEFSDVPSLGQMGSARLLDQLPTSMAGAGGRVINIKAETTNLVGTSEAYDISATIPVEGAPMEYRMLAARPYGSRGMVVFMLVCPEVSCDAAGGDFEKMLETVQFN